MNFKKKNFYRLFSCIISPPSPTRSPSRDEIIPRDPSRERSVSLPASVPNGQRESPKAEPSIYLEMSRECSPTIQPDSPESNPTESIAASSEWTRRGQLAQQAREHAHRVARYQPPPKVYSRVSAYTKRKAEAQQEGLRTPEDPWEPPRYEPSSREKELGYLVEPRDVNGRMISPESKVTMHQYESLQKMKEAVPESSSSRRRLVAPTVPPPSPPRRHVPFASPSRSSINGLGHLGREERSLLSATNSEKPVRPLTPEIIISQPTPEMETVDGPRPLVSPPIGSYPRWFLRPVKSTNLGEFALVSLRSHHSVFISSNTISSKAVRSLFISPVVHFPPLYIISRVYYLLLSLFCSRLIVAPLHC